MSKSKTTKPKNTTASDVEEMQAQLKALQAQIKALKTKPKTAPRKPAEPVTVTDDKVSVKRYTFTSSGLTLETFKVPAESKSVEGEYMRNGAHIFRLSRLAKMSKTQEAALTHNLKVQETLLGLKL